MKKTMLLIGVSMIIFFTSCNKVMDREEAEKSMKVLNSDIVNFFTKTSDSPEFKAMEFLMNEPSAPLPYNEQIGTVRNPFRFEDKLGVYLWNEELKQFLKLSDTANITLLFPLKDSSANGKLVLSHFTSTPYQSRPEFPIQLEGEMYADNSKILTINHQGKLSDGIPETMNSNIEGNDYDSKLDFLRTRKDNIGNVNIDFSFNVKGYNIIRWDAYADIEYGRKGYFFKKINFKLDIFSHRIVANIDYASIDPTSNDYMDSFNDHSTIRIFEMPLKKKVGDIVLDKTDNEELLDYYVRFSNGEQVLISEYIPLIKKILNMKY